MNGKQLLYASILFAGSILGISCNKTDSEITPGLDGNKEARTNSDTSTVKPGENQYSTKSLADEKFTIRGISPDTLAGKSFFLIIKSEEKVGCNDSYLSLRANDSESSLFELTVGDLAFNGCNDKEKQLESMFFVQPHNKTENVFKIHLGDKSFAGRVFIREDHFLLEWPDGNQFTVIDPIVRF